jgi:uncharacterized membrane protein
MDTTFVILRVLHVLTGAVWAGALFVTVLFLVRAIADAGPAGGQVMGALIKRRYFDFVPAVALVTVLSGVELLRRVSSGFDPAWMGSPQGIALSTGGVAGLLALGVGVLVGRPATLLAASLMREAGTLPDGPQKADLVSKAVNARGRGLVALKAAATLLLVAILLMASARYM